MNRMTSPASSRAADDRVNAVAADLSPSRRPPPKSGPGLLARIWEPARLIVARGTVIVVILGLWQLGSDQGWWNPEIFGKPSAIGPAFGDYITSDRAMASMRATGFAVLMAFLLGSAAGTVAGVLLGLFRRVDEVLSPLLLAVNSLPRVALAPLFIVWFGLTASSKIALAVSYVFFVLAENTRSAVYSVDEDHIKLGKVAGFGRVALVSKMILPSAAPTMFSGLRLAFAFSLLGVIASEIIAAPDGIGQDIIYFSNSYQINSVFAILAGLAVVALVVNSVIRAGERRLLRWRSD